MRSLSEQVLENFNKNFKSSKNEDYVSNINDAYKFFKPEITNLLNRIPDEMNYLGLLALVYAFLEKINEHKTAKEYMSLANKYLVPLDLINETFYESLNKDSMMKIIDDYISHTNNELKTDSKSGYLNTRLNRLTRLKTSLLNDFNPDISLYNKQIEGMKKIEDSIKESDKLFNKIVK